VKIEQIVAIEEGNRGELHLVRDRLFWQAWEGSAHLFAAHLRDYNVHGRHFKKVGQSFVWLGVPEGVLQAVVAQAASLGARPEQVAEDHWVLAGLPAVAGFEAWKAGVLAQAVASQEATVNDVAVRVAASSTTLSSTALSNAAQAWGVSEPPPRSTPEAGLMAAYLKSYQLTLEIYRTCGTLAKEYRFSLGERLRLASSELVERLHLVVNRLGRAEGVAGECLCFLQRLRVGLRLLKDLRQVSLRRWFFLNQQIEEVLSLLWPESSGSRPRREGPLQSSSPLPA
jgi:hypothetical protein